MGALRMLEWARRDVFIHINSFAKNDEKFVEFPWSPMEMAHHNMYENVVPGPS